ncbi:hypothetical protein NQD34_002831 [Periophthalmus magnuspinnatus]|nr:hypothetical protein NQD34_002831 [Periophthalmus magnuspinnatus]
MSSYGLVAAVLLACTWAFSEAQSSCKGRCGMGYYRGNMCQCDYSCLLYGECCKDYVSLCTSKDSCKGRCGETFRRGRKCDCDPDCMKYNHCCPDYEDHCSETGQKHDTLSACSLQAYADDSTNAPEPTVADLLSNEPTPESTTPLSDSQTTTVQTTPAQMNENPTSGTTAPPLPPSEIPETTSLTPESKESTTPSSTTILPTTANKETTSTPEITTKSSNPATLAPASEVDTSTVKIPAETQNPTSTNSSHSDVFFSDDSNDMDLCSGRPISGVTTLSNGTVVVFRGHYFWVLDRDRVPGPAQSISHVWGVQSPIDTVFTRCNCQGKTYIFKGPQYWRYENDVLDPGFPKLVTAGFDGLRGHVTAALSVPQYRRRGESVYFFKRGGNVQKYSYQFGTNPSCDRRVHLAVYSHRNRVARQAPAHVSLGPSINYRTSWRGFPATITAAVSIPNKREPEGYNYYVFSKSKSYKIRIEGDRPVIATAKPNASPQSNEVFKCPKKVSTSQ